MSGLSMLPSVRRNNLVVETLGNEILIYDLGNDQASCLNPTASLVWKFADGKTSVAEIAEHMSRELGTTVDASVVLYALEQLDRKHLLSESFETPPLSKKLTRRDFLVKAGMVGAAVAIPVIISIAAPQPAMAATCKASGQPCSTNIECCSNSCNGGTNSCN